MDIVNSRNLKNRDDLLISLKGVFKSIEDEYKDIFVAPITITLGDEWQIIISDLKEIYEIFNKIKIFLYKRNISVYAGIGIGSLSTPLSNDTREMDGEAFINAREALNIAKSNKNFYSKKLYTKDCRVALLANKIQDSEIKEVAITSYNEKTSLIDVINTLIQNNEMIENKYTRKQMEIISLYEEKQSYSDIEKKLNIDKSNISRKLTTSNYFLTIHNKKIIKDLLMQLSMEGEYGV